MRRVLPTVLTQGNVSLRLWGQRKAHVRSQGPDGREAFQVTTLGHILDHEGSEIGKNMRWPALRVWGSDEAKVGWSVVCLDCLTAMLAHTTLDTLHARVGYQDIYTNVVNDSYTCDELGRIAEISDHVFVLKDDRVFAVRGDLT